MQAIILAGGFGTRLQPVVPHVPKPMAPVGDEPFLVSLLRYMHTQGVREVVFALHHQAWMIRDYFGERFAGMDIQYSIEGTPLGTGGAIKRALPMLRRHTPTFVANGDSLVMLNYREMLSRHNASGAPITLASVLMPVTHRYSRLTSEGGRITRYELLGDGNPGAISAGFYVVNPDIFVPHALPEVFSIERDFLAVHTPTLRPAMFEHVEYFIDIGIPVDYQRAQLEVHHRLRRAA
ncbi:MAG: sugar phosphate nucleotidyltransferase [Alphaproteobacteria bacterium]|nr:sugar phosphate nucleotidyltransferase [Alphaproteobacteria bacterium]